MSTKKIQPLLDRVLLLQDEAEEKVGSLIIPAGNQQKPNRGTILAVGEDVKAVGEGDKVLYYPNAGTSLTIEGKQVMIMRYADLIAVV